MKKTVKLLFSLLTAVAMAFGVVLPTVSAQDTNWDEVLTQINAVNQDVVSMEGNGNISVVADGFLNATLNTDFRFNTEERFALELSGDVTGEIISADAEGNETSMPLDFAGKATLLEGIGYLFDGSSWTVEDLSAQEEEVAAQYEEMMAQITEQAQTINDPALTQKYFDLSETDTEYVITLKQDINSDEFWADVESQVNLEELTQQSIDEAVTQAEAAGEPLTEEERQELQEQILASTEAGKKLIFQLIDSMEYRYSKETYYMTYMSMDFSLDSADIAELAQSMGETTEGMPEDFNLVFTLEFNFANHGQVFDIAVPEGAPTFNDAEVSEEASATEETEVSEESEVSEEETTEESDVEETTPEESTEEETTEETAPEEETESAE